MFQLWKKGHYCTDCSAPRKNDNENSNMVSKVDFKNIFQSSLKDMLTKKDKQTKKKDNMEVNGESLDMNVFQKLMEGKHTEFVSNVDNDFKSINDTNTFSYSEQNNIADITPSSQPDRALSALTSGLKPSCNLSQSRYGRTPIACAHTTGDSNTNLSQVSYRNLLTTQYKKGCNQFECFHTQVYQKLNTHQLHLNAPYKHIRASVPTSPVERTN
jgi:hypothetical protein